MTGLNPACFSLTLAEGGNQEGQHGGLLGVERREVPLERCTMEVAVVVSCVPCEKYMSMTKYHAACMNTGMLRFQFRGSKCFTSVPVRLELAAKRVFVGLNVS